MEKLSLLEEEASMLTFPMGQQPPNRKPPTEQEKTKTGSCKNMGK